MTNSNRRFFLGITLWLVFACLLCGVVIFIDAKYRLDLHSAILALPFLIGVALPIGLLILFVIWHMGCGAAGAIKARRRDGREF